MEGLGLLKVCKVVGLSAADLALVCSKGTILQFGEILASLKAFLKTAMLRKQVEYVVIFLSQPMQGIRTSFSSFRGALSLW